MLDKEQVAEVYRIVSDTYPTYDESDDEWMEEGLSSTPYRAIVSVALSTMTNGPRTIKAAKALFEKAATFQELAALDDEVLREAIRSVAHYNRKTGTLKRMAHEIVERHGGQVPGTRDELMALSGIGRKCTDIILNREQGEATIAVDTHVLRVANRLGFIDTASADKAADLLTEVTPARYALHAHEWLIQHGMKTCTARAPKCASCPVAHICESAPIH